MLLHAVQHAWLLVDVTIVVLFDCYATLQPNDYESSSVAAATAAATSAAAAARLVC
jgi:hypothetical protein